MTGPAQAETVSLLGTLTNPEPNDGDNFGYASAMDNGVAVVGAWRNDDPSADVGIAYVYDATTGALLHTLRNPTPQSSDRFGRSVAISGNYALVGAYGDDIGGNGSGAAHLFELTTGALAHTFTNPTPAATDRFGWSVAISGGQAMIGAWLDDAGATDSGAAYVFDLSGDLSTPIVTLTNPTPAFDERFGSSVALSGTVAMAAAQYANDVAGRAGEVYLFNSLTGALLQTLVNPVGTAGEQFGAGIDIQGNFALVGAPNADPNGTNTGAAYLFDVSTSALLQSFYSPDPSVLSGFGSNVSLDGDYALISAFRDDRSGLDAGAAYLFSTLTGEWISVLPAPGADGGFFGSSASIDGGLVLIGAAEDGVGGAAYVYALSADVPLPPAALLLGLGVLALGAVRRRA
jgi:hypothetical protein